MNILYRACASKENFVLNVLEALREKKLFEKCTVVSQTLDNGDQYPQEYYHEIKARYGYQTSYNAICNYDELPAIPKSIWTALLPYKSIILDLTSRAYDMHILNYEEMELRYIKHVRFWNYILDTDNIGFCFFAAVPHTAWEYTVYALAKIKRIPILFIDGHWIPELCSVATDIGNIGSSASACYQKYETIPMDEVAQAFYNKVLGEQLAYSEKERKEALDLANLWRKRTFFKSFRKMILIRKQMIKRFQNGGDPYITARTIWNCNSDIKYGLRQRIFDKRLKQIDYYNKMAEEHIDLNEKYILFCMQHTPEATTLPKADVFSNQLLTIQLLSEAAKDRGIKVYVKEHWSQCGRMEDFYHELSMIPNVYLLRSDLGNDSLLKHAYMVASQTGTCIVEAFIQCIPCLIFAYNASSEAPGVYYVESKKDIIKAIDSVEIQKPQTAKETKNYFAAICKTSVRSSLDWISKGKYTKQEYMTDVVELIADYIKKGMPDDYYYENPNLSTH